MERLKPYRRRLLTVLFVGLGYLWFFILERVVKTPAHLLYIPLDDRIPFVPSFFLFYAAWYVYLLIPAAVLFFTNEEEFLRYGAFLGLALWIACFVYTVWPNGIALRPDLEGAPGFFNAAIRSLYSIDTPTNSAPSLHVAHSIAAHIAITRRCRKTGRSHWLRLPSMILCVLIILSTVLIKQHSVVDLFWGLILAVVLCAAVYGRVNLREHRERRRAACGRY